MAVRQQSGTAVVGLRKVSTVSSPERDATDGDWIVVFVEHLTEKMVWREEMPALKIKSAGIRQPARERNRAYCFAATNWLVVPCSLSSTSIFAVLPSGCSVVFATLITL